MSKKTKPVDALGMRRLAAKAELVKALAHPLRLAIIEFLSGGERCVCEIAELAGAERSNISRHLALMVRAGVLSNRKQGLQVYYSLRCTCVNSFLECATNILNERVNGDIAMLCSRNAKNASQRPRQAASIALNTASEGLLRRVRRARRTF